jgi:hypothetical protein
MRISSIRCLSACSALGLALFLMGSSSVQAQTTYDLASNWSDVLNPNGVWSYGVVNFSLPPGTDNFELLTSHTSNWNAGGDFTSPQAAWVLPSSPVGIAKSTGVSTWDFPVGRVGMHTAFDATHNATGVRWTAPTTTTVSLSGGAWMWRDFGRTQRMTLIKNSTAIFAVDIPQPSSGVNSASPLTLGTAADLGGSSASALQNIPVNGGDTLTLTFGPEAPGNTVGDYVGVDFTVVVTPEPSGVALFAGLATAGGLLVRRRRR